MQVTVRNDCGCSIATFGSATTFGSAVGAPKEKIRIEPVEVPVPSKKPAPAKQPVQPREKEPVS